MCTNVSLISLSKHTLFTFESVYLYHQRQTRFAASEVKGCINAFHAVLVFVVDFVCLFVFSAEKNEIWNFFLKFINLF